MDSAVSWLGARQDGVPEALRAVVFDAVRQVGRSQKTPEHVLRAAADHLLAQAIYAAESPPDPVILLAADALITYVCEYRSEFDPATLDALL